VVRAHLHAPLARSVHLHAPLARSVHLHAPLARSVHLHAPLARSVHLHAPLARPLPSPPASDCLRATRLKYERDIPRFAPSPTPAPSLHSDHTRPMTHPTTRLDHHPDGRTDTDVLD
jgi:hypothetical protein